MKKMKRKEFGVCMIKILLVEDQTLLREPLEQLIAKEGDMTVAGSTDDAAKALEMCKTLQPDLVLMDVVTLNDANGIQESSTLGILGHG
jgi:DNA-binding NarL/FixJ family response regulator